MAAIKQITCETAWQMLLDNEETILVDVRTETEWRTVGIPDTSQTGRAARFVSWTDEHATANPYFADRTTEGLDPDTPILLLCRSGVRSNAAAELLVSMGYTQAINVIGGFESPQDPAAGWKAQNPSAEYHDNL
ncbi:rhodanese-like domain-containing protein [bacterium]|jgi:rhodanese-related sulfurtransferase|nr:rhodanese-like domain-containing protein [bacterium]